MGCQLKPRGAGRRFAEHGADLALSSSAQKQNISGRYDRQHNTTSTHDGLTPPPRQDNQVFDFNAGADRADTSALRCSATVRTHQERNTDSLLAFRYSAAWAGNAAGAQRCGVDRRQLGYSRCFRELNGSARFASGGGPPLRGTSWPAPLLAKSPELRDTVRFPAPQQQPF